MLPSSSGSSANGKSRQMACPTRRTTPPTPQTAIASDDGESLLMALANVALTRAERIPSMRVVDLPKSADVVVVGGGIIGLTIARELALRQPDAKLVVIDKEPSVGAHASSRNSGVLHAGFYYAAESLKARLTRDGNRRLTAWCEEHGIPV